MSLQPTPGMRVEIRDAEWKITRVDRSSDDGYLLKCQGLSELVRSKTAQFLTNIEGQVRILNPANTELVDVLSDGHLSTQLYIDTAQQLSPLLMGKATSVTVPPWSIYPISTINTLINWLGSNNSGDNS